MKNLTLSEGANAMIFSIPTGVVKTIPYVNITEIVKKEAPTKVGGSGISDYIIIREKGREHRIEFDSVLSPAVANVGLLYTEILSWIGAATPTTAAPTTAAPTTAAPTTAAPTTSAPTTAAPVPDYTYNLYWLAHNGEGNNDFVWIQGIHGDVLTIVEAATSFKIVGTDNNDRSFTQADVILWEFTSDRTRATVPPMFLNSSEISVGQLEVYM